MSTSPQGTPADRGKLSYGLWLLIGLALLKWFIHLYTNANYGFHRDELLHLAAAHHPAWGYMEFPPMIAWLGWIEQTFIGDSLLATRFLPAVAGAVIVFLTGLMARELQGGRLALALAASCALGAIAYFRNHTLFQPVAFDQLFWTLGAYFLIRYLRTEREGYLLSLGIAIGLGLLTKYTMLIWAVGMAVGLLFYRNGVIVRLKKAWLAVGIAVLIVLPNLIWQWAHGFPAAEHLDQLYAAQLDGQSRLEFFRVQVLAMNPFSLPVWGLGLYFLLARFDKQYRPLGIAFLTALLIMVALNSKPYYFFAAYPALFAAGGVAWEEVLRSRWRLLGWGWVLLLLVAAFQYLPKMTPALPIERFAEYAGLEKDSSGRLQGLTSDYADMFGWEEQVTAVDSLYRSLSEEDRRRCVIWAENYGEAGAIEVLGKRYGLPSPVCKHGSFWLWGPGDLPGEVAISIGNETEIVQQFYEETILVRRLSHPYAIQEEQNIPLYLCRGIKVDLQEYWPRLRPTIFE